MVSNGEPNPVTFAPMTKKERGHRAHQLLRAAREATAALRAQCPSKERVKETVNEVCRQTVRLLGLSPGPAPSDAASQEKLVQTAGKLAGLLRAYNWADRDIAVTDASKTAQTPHAGESGAADGFDALGKLTLPHASPEGWASELFTSAAKGSAKSEAAIKIGKYLLHPTPLLILDDFTKICGQAIYSSHVNKLNAYVYDLRAFMKDPADESKWPSPVEKPPLDDVSSPLGEGPGLGDVSITSWEKLELGDASITPYEEPGLDDSTSLAHEDPYERSIDDLKTVLNQVQSDGGQYFRRQNWTRSRRQSTQAFTPPSRQPTTETQRPLAPPTNPGYPQLRKVPPGLRF